MVLSPRRAVSQNADGTGDDFLRALSLHFANHAPNAGGTVYSVECNTRHGGARPRD